MNLFRHFLTASVLFYAVSSAAVVSGEKGYVSAENVISQDEAVVQIKQTLRRQHFEPLSTVTNPTYYIVAPTENSYQTAETVITMVGQNRDNQPEYANVRVAIIYNSETDSFSAGEVSVKYTRNRTRL